MILNAKLHDTYQKVLWEESVHTYKRVRKSMSTTGITKSIFNIFYVEKRKNISSVSEFGHIGYVTKR